MRYHLTVSFYAIKWDRLYHSIKGSVYIYTGLISSHPLTVNYYAIKWDRLRYFGIFD